MQGVYETYNVLLALLGEACLANGTDCNVDNSTWSALEGLCGFLSGVLGHC
jgi:hypothetical protein